VMVVSKYHKNLIHYVMVSFFSSKYQRTLPYSTSMENSTKRKGQMEYAAGNSSLTAHVKSRVTSAEVLPLLDS
jgi:hypothetical protein